MRRYRLEKREEAEARSDSGKKLLRDIFMIPAADLELEELGRIGSDTLEVAGVVEDVSARPAKKMKKKASAVSISERGVRSRK